MKKIPLIILTLVLLQNVQAETPTLEALEARIAQLEARSGRGTPLQPSWQDTLVFTSADGHIRLRLGGRVQLDGAIVDGDSALEEAVGELQSGTRIRRNRIAFYGDLYEHTFFRLEYDFAGGKPGFSDAHIGIRNIPYVGTLRIGRMIEARSIEQASPIQNYTFIERGLPAAFNEYRNTGIALNSTLFDQRATWQIAAFKRTDDFGNSTAESGHSYVGRATALPIYENDGRRWLHLGYSVAIRKPDNDTYRVSTRPESFVAPVMADTGEFPADRIAVVGIEVVVTEGPFSLQAEWQMASADTVETEDFQHRGDVDFSGYYVYASYFLTGEHRPYVRSTGTLGKVKPISNFRSEGHGWGAWEVGVRYSAINLNDGPIEGGKLNDWTLGLNWHLNPNMRLLWNYVRADLDSVGKADIVQARMQFDF